MENDYNIKINDVHVYKFQPIDSRMYIIVKNKKALVIDPCVSEEALVFLKDNGVETISIILTHEHYDHISGVNWLKENFRCSVICSENCSKNIQDCNLNLSNYFDMLFINKEIEIRKEVKSIKYICEADVEFSGSFEMIWLENKIRLIEAPGHSKGSICIIINDIIVFTGDTLVNGNKIITRLPGGSKKDYLEKTLPFLKSLSDKSIIFPGHGEIDSICKFTL